MLISYNLDWPHVELFELQCRAFASSAWAEMLSEK